MKKRIKYILKKLRTLIVLWFREKSNKKVFKPTTINFNANDICNSKCTMCNIWKNKKKFELDYFGLKEIFSEDFYSEVQSVGITGGEPTLRTDLIELYKACIESLPKLKSLSIITNAIKETDVKKQIKEINELCKLYNINFSVMVSLDGFGEMHDKIRGRKGNFNSAISVINYSKSLGISTSFGATISKENVWYIDDLLSYARENNLYGRFRVAEFINRLYNNDRTEVIRNFDYEESYHLVLFFEKLKHVFEKDPMIRRTYNSIQNILLGGKRLIGCPYHTKAINLNSRGEIAFCAPKSKILGSGLKESSFKLIRQNLKEKKRLLKEECDSCIHDYHAPISFSEYFTNEISLFQDKYLRINRAGMILKYSGLIPRPRNTEKKYTILIVGWYGTETVGDKAILAGIVQNYKKRFGSNLNFVIGSLYPFITKRTLFELEINARVVSTKNFEFLRYAKYCDEVIIGGGPLMDLEELYIPLITFKIAKKYNRKRIIYGCGLGPLTEPRFINATSEILSLSTGVLLRDFNSKKRLEEEFKILTGEVIGDPSEDYIRFLDKEIKVENQNIITVFLREWTYEYAKHKFTLNEFEIYKREFEESLANFIKLQITKYNVDRVEFHHMHNYTIGNDDRDFSRRFIKKFFEGFDNVTFDRKLSSVKSIVSVMKSSRLNICMRFHSVVFANTLNTSYFAIDYTLGGKIKGYLEQNEKLEKMLTIEDLIINYQDENSYS